MLNVIDHLPEGLLDLHATELHRVLPGPTLIHLPGRRTPALLVTVLLHGNEDTGWLAVRELLASYADAPLPRALSLFVGNVAAARLGRRRLERQPDFNRIWNGGDTPEHGMAQRLIEEMRARGLFAYVDIHNNTGLNPHYACVNVLDQRYLHLATLFSRTVVYFIQPNTVSSMAFAGVCPSVTLECGQPGQPHGTDHARDYIDSCLKLMELPIHPVSKHDIDLFHTVAVVKVAPGLAFGFEPEAGDVWLARDLDRMNFREIPEGTTLGWVRPGIGKALVATDESGHDVGERYFELREGELRTRVPIMPSMFTLDTRVIRQDCLGYVLERYRAPGPR